MASLSTVFSPVRKAVQGLNNALDYSEDEAEYMSQREGLHSSRISMAIKELEEAERIRRDTQNILTRAKIELRKRNAGRARASREAMGGLFG